MNTVLDYLNMDCVENGFGRKAWWARQLGVPPLTISHWMRGRQKPNGEHTLKILTLLLEESGNRRAHAWTQHLWTLYFQDVPVEGQLLRFFSIHILQSNSVEVRTLALLSTAVEKSMVDFSLSPEFSERLVNRLGWLAETSNTPVSFEPLLHEMDLILPFSSRMIRTPEGKDYLKKRQTKIGRRWYIYDCDLNLIRKTFIWMPATTKSSAS